MNPNNIEGRTSSYRETAVTSLAVVGFLALLGLGVWGGVYSSRYVPSIVNRAGSAAVYLGSLFAPAPAPTTTNKPPVAETASSTVISFGTLPAVATTTATTTSAVKKSAPTTSGKIYYRTVPVTVPAPAPYGLSDLSVTVSAIGYLDTSSTDSFVTATKVPDGKRPAVKFTIKNVGTNVSGQWRFNAIIPTRTSYTYKSDLQQALNPGDSIDYTLGFDRARSGDKQTVTITANYDNLFAESAVNNNSISVNLVIL